ncbi:hypothetical protein ACHAWO_012265 [Cyclotella atomus]|uniref:Glycoside hydrolase family 19 catalytic domain-containing protein n=1 Tax=Cyclotella atomus TaxID=382360 RepID=A0ABD3QWG8_9STRA
MVSFSSVLLSPVIFHAVCNVVAADFSTILTEAVFNHLAPLASAPYTYAGFVQAVYDWNTNNVNDLIFSGSTEMLQRHELAAFFGNTLHESDAFRAPREYFMCQNYQTFGSDLYCDVPSTQFSFAYQQYCSTNHNDPATGNYEDGCNCALEAADTTVYMGTDKNLFLQTIYILAEALTGNSTALCQNPELVATDPAYAWGTALWFWRMNTGSVGKTCSAAVLTDGDFGGTVNTINGGLECPTAEGHGPSLEQRLDYYCKAATDLNVDALLTLGGCSGMQTIFDSCAVSGGGCESCVVWKSTPSPSKAPTSSPTHVPTTASPTSSSPTQKPTESPTSSPTTLSPTQKPTTATPSSSPIKSPTFSPTTLSPTRKPAEPPTSSPTTLSPTQKPTEPPTSSPTTLSPTQKPTTATPSSSPIKITYIQPNNFVANSKANGTSYNKPKPPYHLHSRSQRRHYIKPNYLISYSKADNILTYSRSRL